MQSPRHWYIVKKIARNLGYELFKQDGSKFFASSYDEDRSPVLSFCISHKNRVDHIKATLPKNLDDNRTQSDKIEFVLADFQEDDQVTDWVAKELITDIQSGYLKYYRIPMKGWSSPIAKNTAHWLANGELLTNLDADNFTGVEGGKFVIDQYQKESNELMLWQFSRVRRDGSFGRITLTRAMFDQLGGYDEQLGEMGFQDNDLMNRAMAMGIKRIEINDRRFNKAIKHQKYRPKQISFRDLNRENAALSKRNVSEGKLVANEGVYGIRSLIMQMSKEGIMSPKLV